MGILVALIYSVTTKKWIVVILVDGVKTGTMRMLQYSETYLRAVFLKVRITYIF